MTCSFNLRFLVVRSWRFKFGWYFKNVKIEYLSFVLIGNTVSYKELFATLTNLHQKIEVSILFVRKIAYKER